MALRFYVPKFITVEDKLAGLLTFKQLFALLGAFLLAFFTFKTNKILGVIVGIISFGIAILFTFVNVNGKLLMYALPKILENLKSKNYVWKKIEKITYKEIEIPEEKEFKLPLLDVLRKKLKRSNMAAINFEYKEIAPTIKEKVLISLEKPIANQVEEINEITHRHLQNPKNPYRLFPYVRFQKKLKV
jgi:hypothetical protein